MTGPVVPPGGEELQKVVARGLCPNRPPCDTHTEEAAALLLAFADAEGRRRAAEELRAAAEELHVARFNADDDPEARWPHGTPQVAPDTFYRGITVAELALKFRAAALAPENARPE